MRKYHLIQIMGYVARILLFFEIVKIDILRKTY